MWNFLNIDLEDLDNAQGSYGLVFHQTWSARSLEQKDQISIISGEKGYN